MTTVAILKENTRRLKERASEEYDPFRGVGSPIERVGVAWDDDVTLFLPVAMLDDPELGEGLRWCVDTSSSIADLVAENGEKPDGETETLLAQKRIIYDYEFWCAECVKIEDKETKKLIPFILSPPQRASMAKREAMRTAGRPIRQIELKHRQYGSTTEKNAYLFWLQNVVTQGRHVWMISLQQGGAAEIARRFDLIAEHYPGWAGSVTMKGIRNNPNARMVAETGSIVGLASSSNPQGPSGYTAHLVLISEAGKMGSTLVQNADRLITNVTSMVPRRPMTAIMVESTAEHAGRWFREEVGRAQRGESAMELQFTTWLSDPSCWTELHQAECVRRAGGVNPWVETLSDYHRTLFTHHNACLEQVAWYMDAEAEKPKPWMMKQENPTTPDEAFQSTGNRYYSVPAVAYARSTSKPPVWTGELRGKAQKGKEALEELRLVEGLGSLQVWRKPGDDFGGMLKLANQRITNRYALFADPGGKSDTADYSVCKVLDRAPILFGGKPEVVAVWRGHLRPDLFAWTTAQLAAWYENGLLAFEINRMRKDHGDADRGYEPEWSIAVLEEIQDVYDNLFLREKEGRADDPLSYEIGFHMNTLTKPLLVSTLDWALEEEMYVERSLNACEELDGFELKPDGTFGAREGGYDDEAISTMGVVWLGMKYEHLPLPAYISTEQPAPSLRSRLLGSAARF